MDSLGPKKLDAPTAEPHQATPLSTHSRRPTRGIYMGSTC
jgi:hypothetical protein